MSNYRRLISYIYAYEGGIKGKNIGFAKIEARNGQCKISVNVKKVYVGNNDLGVYLLSGDMEILLGKMFVRNGAGEFRTTVLMNNVEKSGQTMDRCYGLTIHSLEDSWQSYTTIWEDVAVEPKAQPEELITHAAEVTGTSPIPKHEQRNILQEDITNPIQQSPVEIKENDAVEQSAEIILGEITAENREQEEMDKAPNTMVPEIMPVELKSQSQESGIKHKSSIVEEIEADIQAKTVEKPPIGDTETLERLDREELEEDQAGRLWRHFRKEYPKIQAFDYAGSCEVLTIKPQDIGLLPRETWTFGNNSFLLHGYYNYRYLILAKLQNEQEECRYLLGVPGHYYSNEKYMASMFGFPDFVLSKMQSAGDGRFGYWYTDISLGD